MKHRIKEFRTKILQMKQKEFCAIAGLDQPQLVNYESKGVVPKLATIEKIAKAFDVNPAWLLGWSNSIKNPNLDTNIVEKVVVEKIVEKVVQVPPPPYWQCDKKGKLVKWKRTRWSYIGSRR